MFGYVRPFRPELKCRDFDLYRATYCGLCRCLRRRYGLAAPMLLNFDFTFLALLLWEPEEGFTPCKGRCHANPMRKLPMCPDSPALELAADESVVLAWWKLQDDLGDEGFGKRLAVRAMSWVFRPAYRKAARLRPEFDQTAERCLKELDLLEKENCPSLDRTADAFARLLQSAAPGGGSGAGCCRKCCTIWADGSIWPTPGTIWRRTWPGGGTTRRPPATAPRGMTSP